MRRFHAIATLTVAALWITLLPAVTSCSQRRNYWTDRGRDLADIFGFSVLGTGIGVNVRTTQWLQAGLGGELNFERHFRMVGRNLLTEGMMSMEFGVAPLFHMRTYNGGGGSDSQVRLFKLGYVTIEEDSGETRDRSSTWLPSRRVYNQGYDRRLFDLGVSVHAFLGLDLDVNPLELVDFLLGWTTYDLLGDDGDSQPALPEHSERSEPETEETSRQPEPGFPRETDSSP